MQELFDKAGSFPREKLREYSEGLGFPATKDDIVAHARKKNLPDEVIKRLEKMPDKKYDNIGEMISSAVKETG